MGKKQTFGYLLGYYMNKISIDVENDKIGKIHLESDNVESVNKILRLINDGEMPTSTGNKEKAPDRWTREEIGIIDITLRKNLREGKKPVVAYKELYKNPALSLNRTKNAIYYKAMSFYKKNLKAKRKYVTSADRVWTPEEISTVTNAIKEEILKKNRVPREVFSELAQNPFLASRRTPGAIIAFGFRMYKSDSKNLSGDALAAIDNALK